MLISHYDCPSAAQLLTRRLTIHAHYSDIPLLNMFKAIKKTLVELSISPKMPIVYLNICRGNLDFQSKKGNDLDADNNTNQHEVIVVYGKFSKFEKGSYTQLFLNP